MQLKKINVLIICYNQEKLIGRTLDSILQQKEWGLNQIVIGDDCSTDGTWNVLRDYKNRYTDIINPLPSEKNLGIYRNMERVAANRGEADLYLHVSGDDPILNGFFEAAQKFIEKNEIDTTKAIGIYSDWKTINPEGVETVHHQNAVLSGYKPWSLYLHGKISSRSLLLSAKVIDRYKPIIHDKGLSLAECMYDSQSHLNVDYAYYMPLVTSIYYSNIGISTTLGTKKYKIDQARIKYQYILDHYVKEKFDYYQAKYGLSKCYFLEHPSIWRFIIMFYYFEKGQLPDLRYSSKYTIRLFGSYFKRYILNK